MTFKPSTSGFCREYPTLAEVTTIDRDCMAGDGQSAPIDSGEPYARPDCSIGWTETIHRLMR
jgi:hypothetical protein